MVSVLKSSCVIGSSIELCQTTDVIIVTAAKPAHELLPNHKLLINHIKTRKRCCAIGIRRKATQSSFHLKSNRANTSVLFIIQAATTVTDVGTGHLP